MLISSNLLTTEYVLGLFYRRRYKKKRKEKDIPNSDGEYLFTEYVLRTQLENFGVCLFHCMYMYGVDGFVGLGIPNPSYSKCI